MAAPGTLSLNGDVPPELRTMIMQCTEDLAFVCSLMYASPQMMRTFRSDGVRVTNAIIRPGEGSELNDMIRILIGIRLSQIGGQSMSEFHQRYVRAIGRTNNNQVHGPGNTGEPLYTPLPADLPPETNRGIILTAYRVWWHTLACLKHYMDRLMALEPSHIVNQAFRYGASTNHPWRERPESRRCSSYHAGPPSRAEEFVVARTFWRLQVQYELQNAAIQGRLHWPAEDIQALFPVRPEWLWGDEEDDDEASNQAMTTVLEYLHATETHWSNNPPLGSGDPSRECRLPRPMYNLPIHWRDPDILPPNYRFPPDKPANRNLQPGVRFWELVHGDPRSPLPFTPFQPFRRLGFAVWDLHRLCALGLLTPNEDIWETPDARHGIYFAWRSILTDGQLALLDRAADERRDEAERTRGLLRIYRNRVIR